MMCSEVSALVVGIGCATQKNSLALFVSSVSCSVLVGVELAVNLLEG